MKNIDIKQYEWTLARTYPNNPYVWDVMCNGELIAPAVHTPHAESLIRHHMDALRAVNNFQILQELDKQRKWYHKWVSFRP